jgi:hypothetical protein
MPLRGRARLKDQKIVNDFDYYGWWKALIKSGVQPSEAWQMDFIETAHVLELEPKRSDFTLALYHQRKQNGAPNFDH